MDAILGFKYMVENFQAGQFFSSDCNTSVGYKFQTDQTNFL